VLEPVSQQMGLQQVPQQQELLQAVVLQAQQFEMVLRTVRQQALSLELVQLLL
jgi:hypothetical protein